MKCVSECQETVFPRRSRVERRWFICLVLHFHFKKNCLRKAKGVLGRQRIHTQASGGSGGGGRWEPSGSFIKTSAARNSLTQLWPRNAITLPSVLNLPRFHGDKSASKSGRTSNSQAGTMRSKVRKVKPENRQRCRRMLKVSGEQTAIEKQRRRTAAWISASDASSKKRQKITSRLVKTWNWSRGMMGSQSQNRAGTGTLVQKRGGI